jgi:chromosome partitioning protein
MKIIVLANRKGGTGKTTLAYNLGATYALQGKRVCFVDLDSQGNLTMLCRQQPCTLEEFKAGQTVKLSGSIELLPATKAFNTLENEINSLIDRNAYLKSEILPKLSGFDYLIIDTSPSLSILNVNAFCVADLVHIVVNADAFSLAGLVEMRRILGQVGAINPGLDINIALNAAHKKRNLTGAAMDQLRKEPGFHGIEIPNRQHFADCNARMQPALDFVEIRDPFTAMAALI